MQYGSNQRIRTQYIKRLGTATVIGVCLIMILIVGQMDFDDKVLESQANAFIHNGQ